MSRPLVERLRSRAWEDRHHRKFREEAACELERLASDIAPLLASVTALKAENARLKAEVERLTKALNWA